MSRIDFVVSLFWLVLGLALCWASAALGVAGPGGPGSGLFPLLAGLLIAGGGAGLLLRHVVTGGAAAPGEERAQAFWPDSGAPRRAITLIVVVTVMILAVPHLGFALSGLVGLPLLYRLIAPGSSWIAAVAAGGTAALLIHVLFAVLLGTPLPRGPLGF